MGVLSSSGSGTVRYSERYCQQALKSSCNMLSVFTVAEPGSVCMIVQRHARCRITSSRGACPGKTYAPKTSYMPFLWSSSNFFRCFVSASLFLFMLPCADSGQIVHNTCRDLLKAVPKREHSSNSAAEGPWPFSKGFILALRLVLRSSASSFLDFCVLCLRAIRIRSEAASIKQAISSTLTGSLVGGNAIFSPCLYSGAVWDEVPKLRFGQTSSEALAHSSTSSQDFVRKVLAESEIFLRLPLPLPFSSFSSFSSDSSFSW
mmetsp:Transcript_62030/g.150176  ORF Transcript_62030/g.150176 Transcript_62030/m.150176 type:complete len:261 (-) Transcript_62030:93-875(-)